MSKKFSPFITLDRVAVHLQGKMVIHDVSWEIRRGEQWVILGPNGSGKSTLVRSLFGGTNLSHGTITFHFEKEPKKRTHPALMKDQIGYVSFELHQKLMEQEDFQQSLREFKGTLDEEYTSARDVVLSGLFASHPEQSGGASLSARLKVDSAVDAASGLDSSQTFGMTEERERRVKEIADHLGIMYLLDRNIARQWVGTLGIEGLADCNFHHLSYGQRRLVLLARAMVKLPALLILDEPCHGLDIPNRKRMLDIIEYIGSHTPTSLFSISPTTGKRLCRVLRVCLSSRMEEQCLRGRKEVFEY